MKIIMSDMKKIKIIKRSYHYECGDGCCSETGYVWLVDKKPVHCGPCEDNALLAILDHLGFAAEMSFEDQDGEEVAVL